MNNETLTNFAIELASSLIKSNGALAKANSLDTVSTINAKNETVDLNLTPFICNPSPCDAIDLFSNVENINDLIDAYQQARQIKKFESDVSGANTNVSSYAQQFMQDLFNKAKHNFSDTDARLIANWVSQLDIYTAVKSIESILYSKPDFALLKMAKQWNWTIHFDHLAIRCGKQANNDAERIAELLIEEHGYVKCQLNEQAFYQFPDGWNAYPLYKILANGQVLRCFIDQSDGTQAAHIIQHWNHVYGYTAHHLAMRVTKTENNARVALTLDEITTALKQHKLEILTPTGDYTQGLLLQVFTKPETVSNIPNNLLTRLDKIDTGLVSKIKNGKLLEIVSRLEMPEKLARDYFALYNINYDTNNPQHSAPYYQYFLPAQAAHVIKTSVETSMG